MEQTNPDKTKMITTIVAGIVAAIVAYLLVTQLLSKKPPLFDKALQEIANEMNKSTPMVIDKETQLDNVAALPENVFQYNYTLVNTEKSSIDADKMEKSIQPMILNTIKTNPEMKIYRDNKTTMAYSYKDKNGEFVLKILIGPDQYEK